MSGGPGAWEMERRYSMAEGSGLPPPSLGMMHSTSEDLHAWSIYRQNLNSDFTDSALGSSEKSPLPYGNFQLRESTVQSILNHPRYGPKSALGSNMYTYLKFGLPRVLPPQGGGGVGRKENSSGYDSSDEGTKRGNSRRHSYLPPHHQSHQDVLHYQPGISARGKSVSQANLLSPDTLMRQAQASHRRSLHDLRHTDYMHNNIVQPPLLRPASVAMGPSVNIPHSEPFSFSMLHPQQYTGLYPHLQIRNMNVRSRQGEPLISNLSMEVKAGEILAIMSTSGDVATALLEVISGRRGYSGGLRVNGLGVSPSDLKRIVALVRDSSSYSLDPRLPVSNALRFHATLRSPHPSRGKIPTAEQVRIVTEELGLGPVLEARISELTPSEKSRLSVALQLLADPQILCIDQLTHTMDIFDTFFLVEFLRQWASGATGGVTGRIVVIALQPPTYEILTMVSRLVVLSGGETMYHGPARQLTHYFTSADYPCPAFKNPADYYLDLVTLDDLSAEAMLESSQRVDQLAELYRRRQTPLSDAQPYTLPPKFDNAGIFVQAYALIMKEMFYSQPSSFSSWISRVLLAALLSVVIGAVFWDVPATDPHLFRKDRLGYHYAVMVVGSLPLLLLLGFSKTHGALRDATESDIQDQLYGRFIYILCTLICTIIPSVLVWMAYLLPAYCMSGLYDQATSDGLSFYLGYSCLSLLSAQLLTMAVGHLLPMSRSASLLFASLLLWVICGGGTGYPLRRSDLPLPLGYISLGSPLPWIYPQLLKREHSRETLASLNAHLICRNKQVQHQDIIVQVPCPVPNGTAILEHHGLLSGLPKPGPLGYLGPPALITLASALVSILLFLIAPIFFRGGGNRKRRRSGGG